MIAPARRWAPLLALASALAMLVPTACTSDEERDDGSRAQGEPLPPALERVETFAFGLGVDPSEARSQLRLGAHDLVVIDGEADAADVAALQGDGAVVLGYLSVGTVEPYRSWFDEATDRGWLLDRWEDWDEWYADLREVGLRDRLAAEAEAILAAGFDGLFLDNVDAVDVHPEQTAPMVQLVGDLRALLGPERLLFAQNGDPLDLGIGDDLDGWNLEDLSFTFDREADGYVPVDAAQRRAGADRIEQVRAAGILVTTADYLPAVDPVLEQEAAAVACAAGAVPFVGDLELTRIPTEPLRCP